MRDTALPEGPAASTARTSGFFARAI